MSDLLQILPESLYDDFALTSSTGGSRTCFFVDLPLEFVDVDV